ncbi:MAG: Gfo/Idh/MocA family oxidoreductase [Planctomycetes bacterium]|nr:Gfo/Idh/MocA family oxidoreductase [Planctomycetota bacterium]
MPVMSVPRIAVVGCGSWAELMHVRGMVHIQADGLADYCGVCDLDAAKAGKCAKMLDAPAYTDVEEMLDECKPDGLSIITGATYNLIPLAAKRRLPFLAEKTPSPDSQTHRRLIEQVGDLPHIVAYNRRHSPYFVQAKRWMEGVEIQAITTQFTRYRRREGDFSDTAIHGIDATLFLAGGDLTRAHIEAAPSGPTYNYFIGGWTGGGTRVDIIAAPDTASAMEHYSIRSIDRSVRISFPQPPMVDIPGYVELHEGNKVVERITNVELNIAADDLPALAGTKGEEERFAQMLNGEGEVVSTLATSLQPQVIREVLQDLMKQGGAASTDVTF